MEVSAELNLRELKELKTDLTRFMMTYKFGLDELTTKIDILKEEFQYIHDYNPIEHVKSRIKSPDSIMKKVFRKGHKPSLESIRDTIYDIAGIRIICAFASDIYKISNMLQNQKDITVINCKDYIKNPKPNGYRSLHLILQVPVFMSDRVEDVCVEVQLRTSAMDFWASLEHKIYYKYNKEVPKKLLQELQDAAISIAELDKKMENINREMRDFKEAAISKNELHELNINNESFHIPNELLHFLVSTRK